MTREEAIEVLRTAVGFTKDDAFAPNWVDAFDRLGILRLEEPKSIDDRITNAMKASLGVILADRELIFLKSKFDCAGLKIVEK